MLKVRLKKGIETISLSMNYFKKKETVFTSQKTENSSFS